MKITTLVLVLAASSPARLAAQGKTVAPVTASPTVKVKEEAPGLLKKAKVSAEAATATAQAKYPGAKLTSAEIEMENGALIYAFDFTTVGKKGVDEVHVDAMTGKLIKAEHESPAAEAKEAAADKAKGAAKPAAKKPNETR